MYEMYEGLQKPKTLLQNKSSYNIMKQLYRFRVNDENEMNIHSSISMLIASPKQKKLPSTMNNGFLQGNMPNIAGKQYTKEGGGRGTKEK